MDGCVSPARSRPSRRKRASSPASTPAIAITLSATVCPVISSFARYTIPTPPRPTSRSITNRPPTVPCIIDEVIRPRSPA